MTRPRHHGKLRHNNAIWGPGGFTIQRYIGRLAAAVLAVCAAATFSPALAQPKPPPGQADLTQPALNRLATLDAEMKQLTEEAQGFDVPAYYCPDPDPPSKREDEQKAADLAKRAQALAQAYRDAKPKLIHDALSPLLGPSLRESGIDPTNPQFFLGVDADLRTMQAAVAKVQAQVANTPIKPCKERGKPPPQTAPQPPVDPNGQPAAGYNPGVDEKKVGGPAIPPPTYAPFQPLPLPDHFCSITEQHNFKMNVYFPWSDAMGKETAKAFDYTQKLQDRYMSLLRSGAPDDVVQAAQRTAEYAEAQAKAMARARTQLADDTYKRIEAIPIVPCTKEGKASGTPPPTPPPGYFNTPHRPQLTEPLSLPPVPDHFCSEEERIAWLKANYFPLADKAIANLREAADYVYDLSIKAQDAFRAGDQADYQALVKERDAYEPIRDKWKAFVDDLTGRYRRAVGEIPAIDCTKKTSTGVGVTPPVTTPAQVGQLPPSLVRPQLERWEMPSPPDHFCSEAERVEWLNKVYNPPAAAALANAEKVAAYLAQLNAAFTQYMRSEGGPIWGAIQREIAEWKPIAEDARAKAEAVRALYPKILAIPVKPCAETTTPATPEPPPAAGPPKMPYKPMLPEIAPPHLPLCWDSPASFQAFLHQLEEIRREAEINAKAASKYEHALEDYLADREKAGDKAAAQAARDALSAFAKDYEWWDYEIWEEIDDYAYDARHTRLCPQLGRPEAPYIERFAPRRPILPGVTLPVPERFCTEAEKAAYIEAVTDAIDVLEDNADAIYEYLDALDDFEKLVGSDNKETKAGVEAERQWAHKALDTTFEALGALRALKAGAAAAPVGCPSDGRTITPPPTETGPKPPCPPDRKPIDVGPNGRVGSSARTREKVMGTAMGLVGGLLGGGGSGGGGASGPPTVICRIKDSEMTVFEDPESGVSLSVGAKETKEGVTVFAKINRSPDSGTFQTAFLENPAGDQQAASSVGICGLWGEWQLTVSWTRTTYVDGQMVSRESGGWSKSGTFGIPGLLSSATKPDGLWKRLGFSNASHGAREVALGYRVTPQDLASGGLGLIVHVTRPSKDPVTTVPFALRMVKGPKGIAFERLEKTPCEEAMRVGSADGAGEVALCRVGGS